MPRRDLVAGVHIEQPQVLEQRAGAGSLLEDLRLFDVYTGDQVPAGHRSLALRMRLRAADRTLTAEDVAAVVASALDEAARRTGALLRT